MQPMLVSLWTTEGSRASAGARTQLWVAVTLSACAVACETRAPGGTSSTPLLGRAQLALAADVAAPPGGVLDVDPGDPPSPGSATVLPGVLLERLLEAPSVAIAQDASGNRCLAGGFARALQLEDRELTSLGARDIFVARYAGETLTWAASFGNEADQLATGVALGPDGSCVIAGLFQGDLPLGDFQLHTDATFPSYGVYVATVFASAPPPRPLPPPRPPVVRPPLESAPLASFAKRAAAPPRLAVEAVPTRGELATPVDSVPARPLVPDLPVAVDPDRPPVLAPPDDPGLVVSVSHAQVLSDVMAPGVNVGVVVDASGQFHVAIPNPQRLGPDDSVAVRVLEAPYVPSIANGSCTGQDTFDLCQPAPSTPSAPRQSCMIGRDRASRDALREVCQRLPSCCAADASSTAQWTDACVSELESVSTICECKTTAELIGVAPGQPSLPPQDACCSAVTDTVCAQAPHCCQRKWDYICAAFAANPEPSCQ